MAMRIIIATGLYPPEIGGPATYSAIMEKALPMFGISVSVVPFSLVRWAPRLVRHVAYFFLLLARSKKADIIIALDGVSVGFPALICALILRKKFAVKIVGDYAWEQHSVSRARKGRAPVLINEFQTKRYGALTEIRRFIQYLVARGAERVVVPSKYLAGIVHGWGVPKEHIAVIYNAAPGMTETWPRETLRRELGVSGFTILSAGRLVPWKGFDVLLSAFDTFASNEATLFIAGDGPERHTLVKKADALKLGDHVRFLGQLPHDELLKYLVAADVFVLNTSYEGLSHMLLESLAAGTPILASNAGGNKETITNGEEGILFDYNDREAIENGVRKFTDAKFREACARRAKIRAKFFSEEKMIRETIAVFHSLP